MADNTILNPGSGGDTIATDDIASAKYQRIKLIHGADGVNAGDVSTANGLPVQIDQTTPGTTNAVKATNWPTTVDTNSGSKSASTPRVVLATDQPAFSTAGLVSVKTDQTTHGTTDLVAADITKVAGSTISQGHGTAATAIRVELPTDGTGVVGLNAGSAIVGKVGIDQTTPGTTNKVSIGTDGVVTTSTLDVAPATQNITVIDSGSASTTSANNQVLVTGSPTANSAASFALSSQESVRVEVTGTWTGTLSSEISIDSGTTWFAQGLHQGAYTTSTFLGNFVGGGSVTGATNYRLRAIATITGTAVVKVVQSINTNSVYIANAAPSGNIVSTINSTIAALTSGSTFTGAGEDVSNFAEVRVSLIASHASATDGLSIQQSSDNSNWDITDTYTIPANTGKTFVVPRQARYFRVVYTNGGTNQTSFRLQTILNRLGSASSSQRAQDAYSNENDLEQVWALASMYNGTTWDRIRGNTTNGLQVYSGTAAADLGKAEDAPHTTGDTGIMHLGVRNDNAATTMTNTNGDYGTHSVDGNGVQFVRQAPSNTPTLANVAGSVTSVTLIAANAARRNFIIYNDSTSDLYVKYGTTASSTSFTYYVPSLGTLQDEFYAGRIDGIWISAAGNARTTEITV